MHIPESVLKKERHKIPSKFEIQIYHLMTRKPDIVFVYKKKKKEIAI